MTLADAYRGRRVLVTGHTGFKGSWLALWLKRLGAQVTGLALPPAAGPSHFEICGLADAVDHHVVDIRDADALDRVVRAARPEVVFHLAAQAFVRESFESPKDTFDINVGGTVNVLESARRAGSVRAIVVVTSDKCYENRERHEPYDEDQSLGGHDPYSASKGAAEIVVAAYRRSFFAVGRPCAAVASARAGNVIGGGDWGKDRLVPDCARAVTRGQPIVLRNPRSTRPWQHVLEPLGGYLLLGERLLAHPDDARFAEAFNFGPLPDQHRDVEQLARVFVGAWGSGAIEIAPRDANAPHEARLLHLACDKAARVLGWRPRLDVETAIRWTADWYRAWHDGGAREAASLSGRQVESYMGRCEGDR